MKKGLGERMMGSNEEAARLPFPLERQWWLLVPESMELTLPHCPTSE